MTKIKYLAIHHTAVSRELQNAQFYAVNRYHKEKWGMKSELGWYTGYNYFIGTNGATTQTRNVGEETVAIKGHNFDTIHVCLAGDFNIELPTITQAYELYEFINQMKEDYPNIEVKLHKDLDTNRSCAGNLFTKTYLKKVILGGVTFDYDDSDREKGLEITRLKRSLDESRELVKQLLAFIVSKLT